MPEQRQSQDINLQQHFPKRKYIAHKSLTEIKTDLITNRFTKSNIERLLHLNPDDCKTELHRLNLTKIKHSM